MNVLRFDSESSWVDTIGSLWRDRLHLTPDLSMCLPSGATPVDVYRVMSQSARDGHVSFAQARVFALDEFGGLAPDDPGRTAHTLRRQLLQPVSLPIAAFHSLHPDRPDIERHCRDYDRAIGTGFDLVVLGVGLNGHLGMNEPGSPIDSETRRVDLHASTVRSSARYFAHDNLPQWGLTVGLKAILSSKEVWLLAKGPTKAEIVQRTVRGEIGLANPASLLRRHPRCSLFVDEEAGSGIRGPGSVSDF
jgi:glucosamine-6-phosphate deaminase